MSTLTQVLTLSSLLFSTVDAFELCLKPTSEFIEQQSIRFASDSISYTHGVLKVLDQQMLPEKEVWIEVCTPEEMVDVIRALKVRGAPLLGVAASLSLAQLANQNASRSMIEEAAILLKNSRPTAVNLACCVDRVLNAMRNGSNIRADVTQAAKQIVLEDVQLCNLMGIHGAAIIQPNERILTYCNSGSLATAGIGTALGVIKTAYNQGKNIQVYACETRPLLQGGRLTAWELEKAQIPYTLICDNMAASLMKAGKIDRVVVGADRIATNGDFANKIGTYALAVLAHHHKIPFHVVAPYTTIDPACLSGDSIVIEERSSDEVRGASGSFGSVIWSPVNAKTYNPAFDVTPAEYVTSYIFDKGNVTADLIPYMLK